MIVILIVETRSMLCTKINDEPKADETGRSYQIKTSKYQKTLNYWNCYNVLRTTIVVRGLLNSKKYFRLIWSFLIRIEKKKNLEHLSVSTKLCGPTKKPV
jgi:hypothetical protein